MKTSGKMSLGIIVAMYTSSDVSFLFEYSNTKEKKRRIFWVTKTTREIEIQIA